MALISNDFASAAGEVILPDDAKEGLFNVRAITLLILWYFFSFCTLFLNKYILSFLHAEPTLLGAFQLLASTCLGFIQMRVPNILWNLFASPVMTTSVTVYHRDVEKTYHIDASPFYGDRRAHFWRDMALVGCMRFSTVILGLLALKYISVSFTETVKSSAPIFTAIMAVLVLYDERCGWRVWCSLIPVAGGLALASAYELSFHWFGFMAALATNLMDCSQNVFSKILIGSGQYSAAQLQFYSSVSAVVVQVIAGWLVMDWAHALHDLYDSHIATALCFDGAMFHLQSITAYALMAYISPVTHSVANTAKRAILIWLSVLVFGNHVSWLGAIGTGTVLFGVLLYAKARDIECNRAELKRCKLLTTRERTVI